MTHTLDQAIQHIYASFLHRDEADPPEQRTIIFDDLTIEKPWGWIFIYNNEKFYQTRDFMDAHVGAGPLFYNRVTGEIRPHGSGCNMEHAIYDYEMELASVGKFWSLWLTNAQDRAKTILRIKQLFKLSTKCARELVPVLPAPLFHGVRRHLDWLADKCDTLEIQTEIKLDSSAPDCLEFILADHMVNPTAAQAFHYERDV